MIQLNSSDLADIRHLVEEAVRGEHEDEIRKEVERRVAAVEAAIAGKLDPLPAAPAAPEPPKPRRARSDKGTRRRLTHWLVAKPPCEQCGGNEYHLRGCPFVGAPPSRLGSSPLTPLAGEHPATEAGTPDATAPAQEGGQDAAEGAEAGGDTPVATLAAPRGEVEESAPRFEPPAPALAEALQRRRRPRKEIPPPAEPDARDPGYAPAASTACSVCDCERFTSTIIAGAEASFCSACKHGRGFHSGRPGTVDPDPLGLDNAPLPGEAGDTNLAETIDAGPDSGADPELGF